MSEITNKEDLIALAKTKESTTVPQEAFIETSQQQIADFNEASWRQGRGWEIPDYPIFNQAMEGLEKGMFLIAGESNGGKALSLDTPILLTNGKWTTIGEINVGQQVWGDDGLPTTVIMKSPVFDNHDCYKMTLDDGSTFIADADHRWKVYEYFCHKPNNRERVYTTEQMAGSYKLYNRPDSYPRYKFRIPIQSAIQYPIQNLPIHPYVLGVWLGNGYSSGACVSVHVDDYKEEAMHLREVGVEVSDCIVDDETSLGVRYRIIDTVGSKNVFNQKLKDLNLINNKHIPEQYLHASIEQRWELLRGLMDTDGSVSHGLCEFCQKSLSKINNSFGELLSSLGIKWSTSNKEVHLNDKVFHAKRFYFAVSKKNTCFKKKRKTQLLRDELKNRSYVYKTIVDITRVNTVPTQCIQVSNASHCYLVGDHLTVTHNTALLQDMILRYSMNSANKLFGIYFSLDDSADKVIPRILASNAKLNSESEFGAPISLFSKPQRYLDRLLEIKDNEDTGELNTYYSYLYEDGGVPNLNNITDTPPSFTSYPNSVRAKTYKWYNEKVVPNFKIVDGTKIHNGEQLYDYCYKLQQYIRADRGDDWNIIVGIDSYSDVTWEDESFGSDKELNDYTSQTIKQWAVEDLQCPIFGTIHLRKIDQRKRPTIADVKESGRWVYEASIVFLVHNEMSRSGIASEICIQTEAGEYYPVIEVLFAKNKQSSYKGRTFFRFKTDFSRVDEVDEKKKTQLEYQILNGV